MNNQKRWICPPEDLGDVVPRFIRRFSAAEDIRSAVLAITGLGVYEARLNGNRIGDFIMAPGWTTYQKRLQVQKYDVTELILPGKENCLEVLLGKGWYRSRLAGWKYCEYQEKMRQNPAGLYACLEICHADDRTEQILTDENWMVEESRVRFSEIYDGEIYDASFTAPEQKPVSVFAGPDETLIPQEGEIVRELERLAVREIIITPAGESVLDFGQEITGYVQVEVAARQGEVVDLSFGEVLDRDGNFYNANYRSALAQYHYICREGKQCYKPILTFYGFRYVRVNAFPGGLSAVSKDAFAAIVVFSDMLRTGTLETGDPVLNRLISNCVWSQKGNFLDLPTDCPQRDERLGWTGDAEVFAKAACYSYDTERFYAKWLNDLIADQHEDGGVGLVIPDILTDEKPSSAWGDAATVIPWEVYLAYGNKDLLTRQFGSMKKWVDYITGVTSSEGLWTGGTHLADWLGLDAPAGSYKGSSRQDFIASAYYAHSCDLVVKAGHALGMDVNPYEQLLEKIREAFRMEFPEYLTQTECVLAAYFGLAPDPQKTADQLAEMIRKAGVQLKTGFVGTPYLLHVLSSYGHTGLAYDLLLRKEYPSWLYPVLKGATTIWEHWDGIMEDGGCWSTDMNSFNHYAYGSVLDWIYGVAAGIMPVEEYAGYEKVKISPHPDKRLGWLSARLETRHGTILSRWEYTENGVRYEITTPVEAEIAIAGKKRTVPAGNYLFFG